MSVHQFKFDFAPPTLMRLCEVEEIIRKERIVTPPPCRQTLIHEIERGNLRGILRTSGWHVTEQSFVAWVKRLKEEVELLAA